MVSTKQEFDTKFDFIPGILGDWMAPYGGVEAKAVLDFGCGDGIQAAGIIHRLKPKSVLGVDIVEDHRNCAGYMETYAPGTGLSALRFKTIAPGEPLPENAFDLCFSWSTFEHIDADLFPSVMKQLYRTLADGGLLFFQVAPLYYSCEGSHLWEIGYRNWEHLTGQIDHIQRDLRAIDEPRRSHLWGTFSTLNKLTAEMMLDGITSAGFELLREYRTHTEKVPPAPLLSVYQTNILTCDQIVALFRKA
jgi:SAM-dependent methyltransferase